MLNLNNFTLLFSIYLYDSSISNRIAEYSFS